MENYTIKVHALKSAARIIGADSLSEMARELEEAGKNNDIDTINEKNKNLLAVYRQIDKMMSLNDHEKEKKNGL